MAYCNWCIIKVISLMDPHESDVTPIIIYSFEKKFSLELLKSL